MKLPFSIRRLPPEVREALWTVSNRDCLSYARAARDLARHGFLVPAADVATYVRARVVQEWEAKAQSARRSLRLDRRSTAACAETYRMIENLRRVQREPHRYTVVEALLDAYPPAKRRKEEQIMLERFGYRRPVRHAA